MRRPLAAFALVGSALAIAGGAGGGVSATDRLEAGVPRALWGVEVDARSARALGAKRLAALRKAGINALVADPRRVRGATLASLRKRAARARLVVLVPRLVRRKGIRTASAARALCRRASRCVVLASSTAAAPRLSRTAGVDLVAVRVSKPAAAERLQRTSARRLLALLRLTPSPAKRPAAWRAAIRTARASPKLDLAVSGSPAALDAYLALLGEQGGGSGNPPPPPPGPPPPPPPPGGPGWSPPPRVPPVPDGPASVWVSTTGSDSTCTRLDSGKPCKTLNRAYRVAQAGDQVEIAAGSYPQEDVLDDPTKTSEADVIFRPAIGAADVVVDDIDVWGDHIEFRRLKLNVDFYAKCGADDVTLRGSKARLFFIRSAKRISLIDTEFGPSDDISQIGHTEECQFAPENIVLDQVFMHDYENPSTHMECVTIQAANNIVVRNSRFLRCQDFDIFIKPRSPVLTYTNMVFENNWFAKPEPTGSAAISLSLPDGGSTMKNVTFRNNSFNASLIVKPEISYSNVLFVGNIGTTIGTGCNEAGVTVAHNVWSNDSSCGPTDIHAATGYVNAAGFDYHLVPSAAAINRGSPTDFPTHDIDGHARPMGGRADAGADERS
jgi:hypothetical protein